MFDLDAFIAACRDAQRRDGSHKPVHELLARAVSEPGAVMRALGEPQRPQIATLYRSDELTVLNVVWGPGMIIPPHNHSMWAVIGVYTGREDNIFWRKLPGDAAGRIEAAGARTLGARDAVPLGRDIVHSVVNPLDRLTGAIHVYGSDFFTARRSEWDAETLSEHPYSAERTMKYFAAAEAAYAAR